jgi:protein tyrosine/serine phosphatase
MTFNNSHPNQPDSDACDTKDTDQDSNIHPGNAATSIPAPSLVDVTQNSPITLPSPPFVTIEGVPNFRDLGGYICPPPPNADPSKKYQVRSDLIYRCATLAHITPKGCSKLTEDVGVRTLYDLRSSPETKKIFAVPEIPNLTRHWTPVYEAEDYSPAVLTKKYKWYTAEDTNPEHGYSEGFVNAYRDIATHGARKGGAYRTILEHLRDRPDEKLVFHCTAGKDRTGVLGAVLLKLCGVSDELVAWEYSTTEPGLGVWRTEIMERMMRGSIGGAGQAMARAEAERICGSRAGNMRRWLNEVLEGEFGGVEKYLTDMCGFSEADVEKIRSNLVVEGEGRGPAPIEGWPQNGGF